MRIDVFVAGWEIPPDFWVVKQGIIQAHVLNFSQVPSNPHYNLMFIIF